MTCQPKCSIVGVSACLVGVSCRYDGTSKAAEGLLASLGEGVCVVPLCPEQLGGLATPRPPAAFVGGGGSEVLADTATVVNAEGEDVTEACLKGARETLRICRMLGIRRFYLKDKSPSCGVTLVTVNGALTSGSGVAAAMLGLAGIELVSVP